MGNQLKSATYEEFVEKFKPKKTTDDCYTPAPVYEAIADWVAGEYGLDRETFVRPFWPGGDFESYDYKPGAVVVDNPPFSILARIQAFYETKGVKYFLFAPALTLFSARESIYKTAHIVSDCTIKYENGAEVNTAFKTNLENCLIRTAPALTRAIHAAQDPGGKPNFKYVFPPRVFNIGKAMRIARAGLNLRIERDQALQISALDAQRTEGKSIFGAGFLLSGQAANQVEELLDKAAHIQDARARATYKQWELSTREQDMAARLDGDGALF